MGRLEPRAGVDEDVVDSDVGVDIALFDGELERDESPSALLEPIAGLEVDAIRQVPRAALGIDVLRVPDVLLEPGIDD
jgi:hypothetical protein